MSNIAGQRNILYWLALGLLAVICCVLAILQYRWIGEISRAEEERLKGGLHADLQRLSRDFNSEIGSACAALQPSNREVDEEGRDGAYATRYERWRRSARHVDLFRALGIAIPNGDDLALHVLDFDSSKFVAAEWPAGWTDMRQQLLMRLRRNGPPPLPDNSAVFEIPRFGGPAKAGERRGEQDWLILEINVDYVRNSFLPTLLATHLGPTAASDYDVEVFARTEPENVVYASRPSGRRIGHNADATVPLFAIHYGEIARRTFRGGAPDRAGGPPMGFGPAPALENGRWQIAVQSRAGSLAALVERTRWRNLVLSGVILVLLLITVGLLLRFSRRAQQLADLQMNFVAGVSHELRTPLTVIRTAAFNLRGKLRSNPAQVEKYGSLIQDEAEKLTNLVEQVLQFSGARVGRVIGEQTPVAVADVIEQLLASRRAIFEAAGVTVDPKIDPELPPVLADEIALRNAVQNLIDNAMKYGVQQSKWIGISARRTIDNGMESIEIRIADRGPGIPTQEQAQIFEPFFRGRRAVEDQIHGTGLGLSLVKKIAEAHGGSVRVNSNPAQGTEFILRLPAAPPELQNEFAPSFS